MLKAVNEKKNPLTNTLIDLLHVEPDLGVKTQLADAIKVLLDPQVPPLQDTMNRASGDFMSKIRTAAQPNNETFVQSVFDEACKKLFYPLKLLEKRSSSEYSRVKHAVSSHEHLLIRKIITSE